MLDLRELPDLLLSVGLFNLSEYAALGSRLLSGLGVWFPTELPVRLRERDGLLEFVSDILLRTDGDRL